MSDIRSHVVALNTERMKDAEKLKAHIDDWNRDHPGQPMSVEANATLDKINSSISAIDEQVRRYVETETREVESAKIREANASLFSPAPVASSQSEVERFTAWAQGRTDSKGYEVDLEAGRRMVEAIRAGADSRDIRAALYHDTGSSGSLVPTELSSQLYAYMTAAIAPLAMPTTKFTTSGGNPIDWPTVAAHGIGTQVISQGTAIGGTDPTFSKVTFNAYRYGQLVPVATEVLQDTGVDILGFLVQNIARAVGEVAATDLVVGSGSGEPNGIMTAIGGAGTIATGGSLIDPTYEKWVDLVYSVNGNYRARPSTAFLVRDLTAASMRKLRDGAGGTVGAVLWQPSLTQGIQGGEPDRFLGHPVWTDPNVASLASNAKVAAFGDFSAYYIRLAGGFRFERSDEYGFNADVSYFRGIQRLDGDAVDTTAYNVMKRSV